MCVAKSRAREREYVRSEGEREGVREYVRGEEESEGERVCAK